MKLTGKDLLDIGWLPGPALGAALKAAAILDLSKDEILKRPEFAIPPVIATKLTPSQFSAPLAVALHPESDEISDNYDSVIELMSQLLKMPKVIRGAVMPDACPAGHAPATITVGGAIEVDGAIIPSAHSADVCCSMYATFFTCEKSVSEIMDALQTVTRFGKGGRPKSGWVKHPIVSDEAMEIFKVNPFLKGLEHYAYSHIADQGDGNHFAYLGKLTITTKYLQSLLDEKYDADVAKLTSYLNKEVYVLVTHHGSRGLGAQVYKRGMMVAEKQTDVICADVPKTAAFISYNTKEGKDYWEALEYIAKWTRGNHQAIHLAFIKKARATDLYSFGNEHNFVWKRGNSFFHGKGATPAWKDSLGRRSLGLIPLNMGREILIVLGNDNDKFLSFAPHGAGRNLSRTATQNLFLGDDGKPDAGLIAQSIKDQTAGLDIRWYSGKADLSETPLGYKDATRVKAEIKEFDLAEVIAEITPLGCIMAGEDSSPPFWLTQKKNKSK